MVCFEIPEDTSWSGWGSIREQLCARTFCGSVGFEISRNVLSYSRALFPHLWAAMLPVLVTRSFTPQCFPSALCIPVPSFQLDCDHPEHDCAVPSTAFETWQNRTCEVSQLNNNELIGVCVGLPVVFKINICLIHTFSFYAIWVLEYSHSIKI